MARFSQKRLKGTAYVGAGATALALLWLLTSRTSPSGSVTAGASQTAQTGAADSSKSAGKSSVRPSGKESSGANPLVEKPAIVRVVELPASADAALERLDIYNKAVAQIIRDAGTLRDEGAQQRLTEKLKTLDDRRAELLARRAKALGVPEKRTLADGRVETLMGFEGDAPAYASAEDVGGSMAVATSYVTQNPAFDATFGAQLDGAGFSATLFETAVVRQHSEFRLPDGTSRLIIRESPTGYTPTGHAEHVTGIMIAAGKDPTAKGMAPAAKVNAWVYEWAYKITPDFLPYPKADTQQTVVSNSSFGVGSQSGRYGSADQTRDRYALTFPYSTMFTSLGNTGPNFATITGDFKESKNQIAVSNTYKVNRDAAGRPTEAIRIYEGSSLGPPDDGRILPFIAASGTSIYSSGTAGTTEVPYTEDSYMYMTGTSMASPAAAGSAIILQQYFSKRFPGHLMRIDTLKALIAQTADEAGNAGPDYKFGFGLMNTLQAANLIKAYADQPASRRLQHAVLAQSQTRDYQFTWDGVSPIKATLSWLDVEGPESPVDNDRTPALVNDLDLLIISPSGVEHKPWVMPYVLNGFLAADYNTPAVRGNNTVDNTEVVQIDAPTEPGVYTLRVSHKGQLQGGPQPFSLVQSGFAAPTSAPAPVITGCVDLGSGWFQIDGTGFLLGAQATIGEVGDTVAGQNLQVSDSRITGFFPFASGGSQPVNVINPDSQVAQSTLTVPANGIVLKSDPATWTYAQNFDTLTADIDTAQTWANDASADTTNSLLGWYAGYYTAAGDRNGITTMVRANNGSSYTWTGLVSYGANGSANRSFGTYRLGDAVGLGGTMRQGLRLVNHSGRTLTGFTLQFTGEQWRFGAGGTRNVIDVSYAIFPARQGTLLNLDSRYTSFARYDAPRYTGSSAVLDGKAVAYRSVVSKEITGLNWAPNQELWICFSTLNYPNYDDGLAIDDLTFTANAIVPPTPFETFINGFDLPPASREPNAAPAGDGISNLHKFVLGGSPLVANPNVLPRGSIISDAGTSRFAMTFPLRNAMTWNSEMKALTSQGVKVVIEQSYDLVTWEISSMAPVNPELRDGVVQIPAGEIAFSETASSSGHAKVFFRLRVDVE